MKLFNCKYILLSILCFGQLAANASEADSVTYSLHDHRIHHLQKAWQKLMPSSLKLQYAGSMGVVSLGIGWDYGHKRQWETDFFVGYLPKFDADDWQFTTTLKENYIPWSLSVGKRFSVEPLTTSIYVTSIPDDKFWPNEPERYPGGYYWFSLRFRTNAAIGQRFVYNIAKEKQNYAQAISFYYELGTNDFYVLSAWGNDYVRFEDIIHLSLGIKMQLY